MSVATDTPRFLAAPRGGISVDRSFVAHSILLSVIWRYSIVLLLTFTFLATTRASFSIGQNKIIQYAIDQPKMCNCNSLNARE